MPLVNKGASLPPLGLISLAALLPEDWQLELVDLNVETLSDAQVLAADAVFTGGMRIQSESLHQILARARALGRLSVVGGPAPTTGAEEYTDADIVFCGEAEGRIDQLVDAIAAHDGTSVRLTSDADRPSMAEAPVPRFDLIKPERYTSISVQYSRGCPFSCEFCDIIEIYGRVPRLKRPDQVLAELDTLYRIGWRGSLFFVDDNFIGNRTAVRKLLPQVARWQREHGYPFELYTEASVNLATDDALIKLMVEAGFASVFLGIETPDPEALKQAKKRQNVWVDLTAAIDRLTESGLEVMGGFIVGFDQDDEQTFEVQRRFIADAPIPLAMVGLLTALPDTQLWRRLSIEGRLRANWSGDQFGRPNFVPAMDERTLLEGYAGLLQQLYSPEGYYRRCHRYLERVGRVPGQKRPSLQHVKTLLRSFVQIGLRSPWRTEYWKLLARAALRKPHAFATVVGKAVQGEHMIRYTRDDVVPRIRAAIAALDADAPEKREEKTLPKLMLAACPA